MACPTVLSGSQFLVRSIAHLDCQAQTLGSFGFQSLAGPGSPAFTALTALLTLFVAVYGVRLLLGSGDTARDLVTSALKVGIVLTIALSWPAWRVLAYDTVLYGPSEVAAAIIPSTMPDPQAGFPERLQAIDNGMARLAQAGTGRQTGAVIDEGAASGFRSIALEDETGLGWARTLYLASTLGSLAALRVAGGLLLALAPLFAGLLLFDLTRGLFAGWLSGLVLVGLGSLGVTILLSLQMAVTEPWLADVLIKRALGYATPNAPTELLALVLAFGLATAGLMALLARLTFHTAWSRQVQIVSGIAQDLKSGRDVLASPGSFATIPVHSRALAISESVATSIRREESSSTGIDQARRIGFGRPDERGTGSATAGVAAAPVERLGSGSRRNLRRNASSQRVRDGQ